ncbi:MAG: flagellar biosynthesis protein [Arenicella sp.]|jgi:flagellar biosynthesis protein
MNKTKKETKKAIGLKYNSDDTNSPTVIAKGFGDLADEIIELAKQNGVMIHEDPYLSELLARMDLGQEIPDNLYHVVAELIAFSYVLQGKFPDSWSNVHNKIDFKE